MNLKEYITFMFGSLFQINVETDELIGFKLEVGHDITVHQKI